jgi:hypothetical protein
LDSSDSLPFDVAVEHDWSRYWNERSRCPWPVVRFPGMMPRNRSAATTMVQQENPRGLDALLALLARRYGEPPQAIPRTPFQWIVWENAAYLVNDTRRGRC